MTARRMKKGRMNEDGGIEMAEEKEAFYRITTVYKLYEHQAGNIYEMAAFKGIFRSEVL